MKHFSNHAPIRLILIIPCSMVCAFLTVLVKSILFNLIEPSSFIYRVLVQSEPVFTTWTLVLGMLIGFCLMKGKTLSTPMEDAKTKENAYTKGRMKINDIRYLLIGVYLFLWIVFLGITIQWIIQLINYGRM